jgi:hypothetical protein
LREPKLETYRERSASDGFADLSRQDDSALARVHIWSRDGSGAISPQAPRRGRSLQLVPTHPRRLEQGPYVGARAAADRACKLGLQVGQANVVAPLLSGYDERVTAFVIAAVDEQPTRTGLSPFPERDFLRPLHRAQF